MTCARLSSPNWRYICGGEVELDSLFTCKQSIFGGCARANFGQFYHPLRAL